MDPVRKKQISDLGFNVVRLGAMWTGVEPEEDNFNKTYIDIIEVGLKAHSDKMYLMHIAATADRHFRGGKLEAFLSFSTATLHHSHLRHATLTEWALRLIQTRSLCFPR